MALAVLEEDKPKILFHAAMMAIQNFGFFIMYYDIWGHTPHAETCDSTRFAAMYMSLSCFLVAFLCVGMAFGGYTADKFVFALYWTLHLIGGVGGYSVATVLIPLARFSDEGDKCALLDPVNGDRIKYVFFVHGSLYLVYVGGMLSITWFSYVKPTWFSRAKTVSVKAAPSSEQVTASA